MADKTEVKSEALPDLDDLLQCPVCYEIPSGQIFQCNEGHHVCGRCKMRLDMCPVCRALFFGTRNYAMEELIANVRKLRAFKLGGKVTTGSDTGESNQQINNSDPEPDSEEAVEEESNAESSNSSTVRAHQACKGLFRCLCCKNGNGTRLPLARLLNHLRYHHAPELIEGQSENGEYVQAWQISTVPGRIVTAVRVADMGIFFLNIEITEDSIYAWLSMAASPWVAHEFSYTVTISGNDREAIFSDCVWSVRSCEGSLKKRGHCLVVGGADARALLAPSALHGKLTVRRTPPEQLAQMPPPRAVLRVANRGNAPARQVSQDLEPFLQDLQNDVARLSRAFATLGREADALVRSEAEMRARIEANPNAFERVQERPPPAVEIDQENEPPTFQPLSRNARRRLRRRLRGMLDATGEILENQNDLQANAPIASPANPSNALRANASNALRPNASNAPRPNASNASRANAANASHANASNTTRANVPNGPSANVPNAPRANIPNVARANAPNPPRANVPNAAVINARNTPNVPRNNASSNPRNNPMAGNPRSNGSELQNGFVHMTGLAIVQPPVPPPPVPPPQLASGSRDGHLQNGNQARTNKKRRRQRR